MKCIVCGKKIEGDPVITEHLGDMPTCSWKCVDKITGVNKGKVKVEQKRR